MSQWHPCGLTACLISLLRQFHLGLYPQQTGEKYWSLCAWFFSLSPAPFTFNEKRRYGLSQWPQKDPSAIIFISDEHDYITSISRCAHFLLHSVGASPFFSAWKQTNVGPTEMINLWRFAAKISFERSGEKALKIYGCAMFAARNVCACNCWCNVMCVCGRRCRFMPLQ